MKERDTKCWNMLRTRLLHADSAFVLSRCGYINYKRSTNGRRPTYTIAQYILVANCNSRVLLISLFECT